MRSLPRCDTGVLSVGTLEAEPLAVPAVGVGSLLVEAALFVLLSGSGLLGVPFPPRNDLEGVVLELLDVRLRRDLTMA